MTDKRIKHIKYIVGSDKVRKTILSRTKTKRGYRKSLRIFREVRKKSRKHGWSVKKFNYTLVKKLSYGRFYKSKEMFLYVKALLDVFWLKDTRIRNLKVLIVWLGGIDTKHNSTIFALITRDYDIVTENSLNLPKHCLLKLRKFEKEEKMMRDIIDALLKDIL